ncbi:hypothetical protein DPEC_G00184690 [Dallia pectoralis]|uniref:Uncharacterized protein n=1 Tax=Dallia pectoralis TaxID=75939 RepID=A0ACC2GBC1_DALPE|nr:hypothetical protein DPEC_G00184690 [Dallia pectoralis]
MKSTCLTGVMFWLVSCSTCQTDKYEGIDASNVSVFLLDPHSETLYLGARGSIMALHASNLTRKHPPIKWEVSGSEEMSCSYKTQKKEDCGNYICLLEFLKNKTIYVCGSYAFNPQCAFMDPATFSLMMDGDKVKTVSGRGKCPYNPRLSHTAVTADGVLYTAASTDFMDTASDITRATDPPNRRVRMYKSNKWLNEPKFVSSALVKDGHGGDTIYFFFTENAKEYKFYTNVRVTRVARICKTDAGGSKTLQDNWTSYLKAQLVCRDKVQSYTLLSHVSPLEHRVGDPSSTHFYALFTSQWDGEPVSALCVYSLADISKRFATGGFWDMKTGMSVPGPTTRPGKCEFDIQTGQVYNSTVMPDMVLQFVKEHPLMSHSVDTVPLLVRRGITYTRIAATNMSNTDAAVLQLGTDQGELHSISIVGRNVSLLNEIAITTLVEPINNILIHQGHALVSSPSAVSRVLVEGCIVYRSCEMCARAQGLECTWDVKESVCVAKSAQSPVQNKSEDPLKECGTGEGRCSPLVKELRVRRGLVVLLPCVHLSPLSCVWEHPPGRHTRLLHSHLVVTVSSDSTGLYSCRCPAQSDGSGIGKLCLTASYQLTMEEPCINASKLEASVLRQPVVIFTVFVLGVLIGVFVATVFLKRQRCHSQLTPLEDRNCSGSKEGHAEPGPNCFMNNDE